MEWGALPRKLCEAKKKSPNVSASGLLIPCEVGYQPWVVDKGRTMFRSWPQVTRATPALNDYPPPT